MSDLWLTAAELAGLPGMPASEFRARAQLKADAVQSRPRAGRGGGREFNTTQLPAVTQQALFLKRASAQAAATLPAAPAAPSVPVPRKRAEPTRDEAACADARLVLLRHLHTMAELGMGVTKAAAALAAQLSSGDAERELLLQASLANQRTRAGQAPAGIALSARTLMRWHMDHLAHGWQGLLPAPSRSLPLSAVPADVAAVLGLYANASGASRNLTHCAQRINTQLGRAYDDWRRLYEAARRALPKVPKVELIKARHTGAERAAKLPFRRRRTDGLQALDVCLIDGHTFKAKVRHPDHGQPFAPEVTVVIDAATRRVVGWSASLSENTIAVGDAIRHSAQSAGVAAIYYSDNGAGERAKVFDCPTAGLFARLGAEHRTGIPGHPQGHGLIERSWRTHMIRCARQYGSYQGGDADSRSVRNVRLELDREQRAVRRAETSGGVVRLSPKCPGWDQFLADVAKEVERYNSLHRHRSLPKHAAGPHAGKHMTPDEAWELMFDPADQLPLDGPQLRHLFMPAKVCTAQRGEVQLHNKRYFHPELMQVDRERVVVHFDIHDPRLVWAWTVEGKFICEAGLDTNAIDYFPKSVVQEARERRVRGMVRRREQQIETAMRELQPTLPAPAQWVQELPTPPVAERVEQCEPAGRPFFESASDRYEWLMRHRALWTADDTTWAAAFAGSDEYQALQGYFTDRGIAWPAEDSTPRFDQAG